MIDDLRQIAIFAKTVEHGSFRGAAKALNLSPSVVSHHISQLEDRLGVALLYRSTRKIALTREGEALLSSAQTMLAAAEAGLSAARGRGRIPHGHIRLSMPSVLSRSKLMQDLAQFSDLYPQITLEVIVSDNKHHLIEDGFDLAIRMGTQHKRSPSTRALFKVRRQLLASRDYLASRTPLQSPGDLNACNWIRFAPVKTLKPVLRKAGEPDVQITPQSRIEVNDVRAIYQMVKAGAGIALLPDFIAEADVERGDVCVLFPDWEVDTLHVFADWPANAPREGIVRLLVDHLSATSKRRALGA